jgi:hypothetical protein
LLPVPKTQFPQSTSPSSGRKSKKSLKFANFDEFQILEAHEAIHKNKNCEQSTPGLVKTQSQRHSVNLIPATDFIGLSKEDLLQENGDIDFDALKEPTIDSDSDPSYSDDQKPSKPQPLPLPLKRCGTFDIVDHKKKSILSNSSGFLNKSNISGLSKKSRVSMFVGDVAFERKNTGDKKKTVEFGGVNSRITGVKFEDLPEKSFEDSKQDSVKMGGVDFEVIVEGKKERQGARGNCSPVKMYAPPVTPASALVKKKEIAEVVVEEVGGGWEAEGMQQEPEVEADKIESLPEPTVEVERPEPVVEAKRPEPEARPQTSPKKGKANAEVKKPEPKAEPNAEVKKPEPKAEPNAEEKKPEPKAEPNAEVKKPEPKAGPNAEVKNPEPRAEPNAEVKNPEPKSEVKNPEPKSEVKNPEPKSEVKKPEPKSEVKKPEPKSEVKNPEPKASPKKENRNPQSKTPSPSPSPRAPLEPQPKPQPKKQNKKKNKKNLKAKEAKDIELQKSSQAEYKNTANPSSQRLDKPLTAAKPKKAKIDWEIYFEDYCWSVTMFLVVILSICGIYLLCFREVPEE